MTNASSAFSAFVLSQVHCAGLRARLMATEIDSIDVALRGNFITTDDAIAWLHDAGAIGFTTLLST